MNNKNNDLGSFIIKLVFWLGVIALVYFVGTWVW